MSNEITTATAGAITQTSTTVNEQLGEFMSKFNDAITVVSNKLMEASPDVVELLLRTVQVKSTLELVTSFGLMVLGWFGIKFAIRLFKSIDWKEGQEETEMPKLIASLAVGTLSLLFVLFQIGDVVNVMSWIGALFPEGYIALKAMDTVGINL